MQTYFLDIAGTQPLHRIISKHKTNLRGNNITKQSSGNARLHFLCRQHHPSGVMREDLSRASCLAAPIDDPTHARGG
jgi:hypothetical protein